MNFQQIIEAAMNNLPVTIAVILVFGFLLLRIFKTARMYLGAKSYVKSAIKLDRKKFNGLQLVDKTKRKRKKESNSFNKLRQRAKNQVRKYFEHKLEELPVFTAYAHGKLFKRSSNNLSILIKRDKKVLKKITNRKGMKNLLEAVNKYQCLDEMVIFLHNLPEAILESNEYDIYCDMQDITITYAIK